MIFILLTGFVSSAQYNVTSKYFVYLQTEPAQPFFIRINGQQLSANASGYLILPQLKDGDYKLVVGFPQNKYPEQSYNFTIDSKDKGYLIKDFGGSEGWGLFDLQTMAVQKSMAPGAASVSVNTPAQPATVPKEDVSDFTKVLSKAANDPGLLEKPKEEPKPVVVEQPKPVVEEKPEVAVIEQPKPVVEERTEDAVTEQPKPVEREIEAVSSAPQETVKLETNTTGRVEDAVAANHPPSGHVTSTSRGTGGVMVTYDNLNEKGQAEPVTIFIPEPRVVEPVVQKQPEPEPVQTPVVTEPVVEAPIENQSGFKVEEKPATPSEPAQMEPEKAIKTNDNCKRVADESDFLRLRRQMAQRDNDESMIAQARSAFKSKCYTTAQVKYLSSMFLSNAGKYNFYEVAYPHVADSHNFASLESELRDQFYKDKFNTLIGR